MRLFEGTQWDVPPTCDRCEKLESECQCPPIVAPIELVPNDKQTLNIRVEKRKRGKTVTVISGLADNGKEQMGQLLTELKNFCGSGGTIKDGAIEIQGDHDQRIKEKLLAMEYRVKK